MGRPRRRGRTTKESTDVDSDSEGSKARPKIARTNSDDAEVDTDLDIPEPTSAETSSEDVEATKSDKTPEEDAAEAGTEDTDIKSKAVDEAVPVVKKEEEKNENRPRRSGWWSRS